ncbi:MAG: OmpA family protein [Deltaproteobacteria bacterium]|nr:OmpA family protein [Deltaproteobacteria bacterium]
MSSSSAELKKTSDDLAATLKDKAGLKSSVDEMKSALEELNRRKAEADRRIAEYKNLLARFQSLIDAGKLKVKIVDGRMVVALASDILFASGSAGLSKDGKSSVEEVAAVLASIPDRKFQVEGHTDNVPIKTAQFPSNWELASSRSLTVLKTMVEAGMPADRVSAASFGDSKPAAANDTPDNKALNRRIEIVVVPDLSTLPGFDELKKTQ